MGQQFLSVHDLQSSTGVLGSYIVHFLPNIPTCVLWRTGRLEFYTISPVFSFLNSFNISGDLKDIAVVPIQSGTPFGYEGLSFTFPTAKISIITYSMSTRKLHTLALFNCQQGK